MLKTITDKVDLCVVGGGMSGIAAAIAAARQGITVALVHERPVLGGNASSEIRMWVCGAGDENRETGIIEEIMLESQYRNPTKNYHIWDTILYDFVKREKNIHLYLNTTCMDARWVAGDFPHGRDRRITHVIAYQMTTQKMVEIEANYFADCSGDSILAPLTGASFMLGRESRDRFGEDTSVTEDDNKTMGMSCLIQGRETTRQVPFIPPTWATKLTQEDLERRPFELQQPYENFWYLELGGDRDSIGDTESIRDDLVSLALGAWDAIKNGDDNQADRYELEFLGFLPGKRESRRMIGEYIITQRDIAEDRQFEDTVAFGGWGIDDHYPGGYYHKGRPNTDLSTPAPYCIPYRSLYSKNVDNLFFAGRNISMTHMAMSSIRVMATCSLLGEAVGCAAAVATKHGVSPQDVYIYHLEELQGILLDSDCFLPNRKRKISDACNAASLFGGAECLRNSEDRVSRVYGNDHCGCTIENGQSVEYRLEEETLVEAIHIVFDSDLKRDTQDGHWCERTHVTRANVLLDSPDQKMPATLCRSFRLLVVVNGREQEVLSVEDNRKRSYHIPIHERVFCVKLIPLSNWGETQETTVFSFDF